MKPDYSLRIRWLIMGVAIGLFLAMAVLLPLILVQEEPNPQEKNAPDPRIAEGKHVYRVSESDTPRVDAWLNGSLFHPNNPVDITIQMRPPSLGLLQTERPPDSLEITANAELVKDGQLVRTAQAKLVLCRVSPMPAEYGCTWFDPFQVEYPRDDRRVPVNAMLPVGRYVIRLEIQPPNGEAVRMPDFPITLEVLTGH